MGLIETCAQFTNGWCQLHAHNRLQWTFDRGCFLYLSPN